MPKEAFADLWYTLQRGEVWVGLVKNRRKNGEFYWVRAHVAPIIERGELMGYTSVRVRPSEEEKREAEEAYRQIREGQERGLRLEAGRITRTGLLARLRRINPAAMQTRLYGAIAVCVGTIAGGLGVSLWSYSRMAAEVAAANAAISMPVMLQILTDLQAEQSTVLGWQIGLSALAVALLIGGNLQYHFGKIGAAELVFPATPDNNESVTRGGIMLAGGGGDYLRFSNGAHDYIVYSAEGRGSFSEGVVVEKSGKQLAALACSTYATNKISINLPDGIHDDAKPFFIP